MFFILEKFYFFKDIILFYLMLGRTSVDSSSGGINSNQSQTQLLSTVSTITGNLIQFNETSSAATTPVSASSSRTSSISAATVILTAKLEV
jgi:hypothetical protein